MISKMPNVPRSFLLQSSLIHKVLRYASTQALIKEPLETFRTSETNPVNHSDVHIGHYYTVPPNIYKLLYSQGGFPGKYTAQIKTFTEACIMVRKPTIDIINYIKTTNYEKPTNRYVLYGKKGTGKSLTLCHLIHFASQYGMLIVHVPWVSEWLRRTPRNKEVSTSVSREGFVDLPLDAAAWLLHFKAQNAKLLKEEQLTTTNEYVWTKREVTPIGSSLTDLIDHGINRVKFSSDVVIALLEEIKMLSRQGKCKTFVAIDGFNTFYYPLTRLSTPSKKKVTPFEVTLSQGFLNITTTDWNNGVIVLSVDEMAVPEDGQGSYLPRFLLGKEGFEHLDPFIPIKMDNYTEKEFASCLAYYRNRLWLREPNSVDDELAFLSALNPYRIMEMCASL